MKPEENQRFLLRILLGGMGVICLGIFIVFGLWLLQINTQKPPYTGPVVHVSTGYVGEYAALLLIAKEQGFFTKYGIDATLQQYNSGPESLGALLGGQVDMAVGSDFAGVSDSFQGEDLKLLATVSKSEAFYLIGRKDHGFTDNTASLKGKKVGITQKTVGEFYMGQFLTFNGLSPSDIQVVNMKQADLLGALANGTIDAAALFQPNAHSAQQELGAQAVTWPIQSGQSIYSSLYTTGKFTQQHPDVIARYTSALYEAEKYIQDHDSDARRTIAEQLHYTDDYINAVWPHFTFELSLEEELLLNMDDEARWAIENKLTTATTVPNYLHLLYFDSLEAVKPEGISVIR